MARREIDAFWDRKTRNNLNENFKELYDKDDNIQQQVNDLVLESGGDSNLEVVQARGGHRVLNDRLNSIDSQLAQTESKLNQTKANITALDYRKADKTELEDVNNRIDTILTEPAENVSQQEIIDARQGEPSLGANLTKIKDAISHDITNKIINGDFAEGIAGWSGHDSNLTYSNKNLRVTGTGGHQRPRASQTHSGGFTGGNKVYLKGEFRVSSIRAYNVGFSVYRAYQSGVTVVDLHRPHPPQWEWVTVDGIVDLPDDGVGDIAIQVRADYGDADSAEGQFFEVNNIVYIDLTEAFGMGKEPSVEDVRSILSKYPKNFFEGNAKFIDLGKSNIENKANKSDIKTIFEKIDTQTVNHINHLPVSRKKFNENTIELFSYNNSRTYSKVSMYQDNEVTFEGNPTYRLVSINGASSFINFIGSTDLSDVDYIDFYFYVENMSGITNLQIDLEVDGNNGFASYNLVPLLNEVKEEGLRVLRIHMENFVVKNGTPDLSDIRRVRVGLSGVDTSINLAKIEASKVKKGAVYFYFDDATIDHYTNAFPIMQEYGLRGTISVPTERVGKDVGLGGQRVTWAHLREMEAAGWLVVSHGLDEKSLAAIPIEEAEYQIKKSSQMLQERGFVFGSKCIVAPQGSWSDEVDEVARKYMALCRTKGYSSAGRSEYAMEYPQSHPRAQYYRSPINTTPIQDVKNWIDNAITKKKEVAIAWHRIRDTHPDDTWTNTTAYFEEICAYVRDKIDQGVLDCVTWRDTMLQSWNVNAIDTEGSQYMVSDDGKPTILTLPIRK